MEPSTDKGSRAGCERAAADLCKAGEQCGSIPQRLLGCVVSTACVGMLEEFVGRRHNVLDLRTGLGLKDRDGVNQHMRVWEQLPSLRKGG